MIVEWMNAVTMERPVGTQANNNILNYLEHQFADMGYSTRSIPFDCLVWSTGNSTIKIEDNVYHISASPFSQPFSGTAPCAVIGTLEELGQTDVRGKILVLRGELSKVPMQPKDYPFYDPDEHKEIITSLENSGAVAVLAITEKHPTYGMEPFYMFEDGNFKVPSAYMAVGHWEAAEKHLMGSPVTLNINSQNRLVASRQLIAGVKAKNAEKNVVVCAHMDSKYKTPGALDNAAGLVMMIQIMDYLKNCSLNINIEFVPFNSEEYFGVSGELAYTRQSEQPPDLVINIDSPGHIGSKIAISTYNVDDGMTSCLANLYSVYPQVENGQSWYSGDHAIYAMQGIPSIAVTSSDLFACGLEAAHTMKDTVDTVDFDLLDCGAKYLTHFIKMF